MNYEMALSIMKNESAELAAERIVELYEEIEKLKSHNKDYAKYTLKQILAVLNTCNGLDEAKCYFQAYFA